MHCKFTLLMNIFFEKKNGIVWRRLKNHTIQGISVYKMLIETGSYIFPPHITIKKPSNIM